MSGSINRINPPRIIGTAPRPGQPTRYIIPTRGGRPPPKKGQRPTKKPRPKDSKDEIRGRDISIRESAAEWSVIYGRMRVGGAMTFVDTGHQQESKAHLTTGSEDAQIAWTAKDAGADGNAITITLVVPTSAASSSVAVVGTDITVTVKSSGGNSQATANNIIALINADGSASALVRAGKGDGKGTSNVAAQAQTNLTGGGGTWLHTVHTLCCHEINSLDYIYLDNEVVEFGGTPDPRWAIGRFKDVVFATYAKGTDDQDAIGDLIAQLPDKWTDDHKQSGRAHVYMATIFRNSVFPNGEPDFSFQVSGRKVFDPRDAGQTAGDESTYVFSTNAALICADFLTNQRFGFRVPWARVNLENLAEAANDCDELVRLQSGAYEPRYSINASFNVSLGKGQVLREMERAMAGTVCRVNGLWNFFPGKYRAPTVTLSKANARGAITVITKNARRDLFNGVKGTFIDANAKFQKTDFPAVTNSTYLSQDGGVENFLDVHYAMVTSGTQAQRLARIELEKSRQGIRVNFPCDLSGLRLYPSCPANLDLPELGFNPKEFVVDDIEDLGSTSGDQIGPLSTAINFYENAAGIWDWDASYETVVDVAPNTSLKSPFDVSPPTDVVVTSGTSTLYIRSDGTVGSRMKIVFTEPSDFTVTEGGYYEVQYRRTVDSQWLDAPPVQGGNNVSYIYDVQDGEYYNVRVRAVNGIKATSEYATFSGHLVVGKTEPPSDVTGFTSQVGSFGIDILVNAIPDLDFNYFEIRRGTVWETAIFEQRFSSTTVRLPTRTSATYDFLVKAVDTSLNESLNATAHTVVIPAPDAPSGGSYAFDGGDAVLRWSVPSSLFAIDTFLLYTGTTFETSTALGEAKASVFKLRASWSGTRNFWIVARDVAGNVSAPLLISVVVVAPGIVSAFRPEVVDNNVNFYWTAPASGTLPIDHYKLYKGDIFATADLLGEAAGTFHTKFEYLSGTYTYWLIAVDVAGNEGPERSVTALVNQPPDFELEADVVLDPLEATVIHGVLVDGYPYFAITESGTPLGLTLVFTQS